MCGIAGILRYGERPIAARRLKAMCDVMAHRGPDDAGYAFLSNGAGGGDEGAAWSVFTDERFRHRNESLPVLDREHVRPQSGRDAFDVALGHRRLAILDLTSAGHQPMADPDRRLWLTYNGEIYNFRELRAELEERGHRFGSRTDTEVLVRLLAARGLEALSLLNGMFAFALFDRASGTLTLARDRFGVKPLYYAASGEYFVFASEIKGVLASGLVESSLDPAAVVEYMTFQNHCGSDTLFSGVRMLPRGTFLQVRAGDGSASITPRAFTDRHAPGSATAAADSCSGHVARLFERAVDRQLVADVEIGSFLSGGMDSGSIVSVAAQRIPRLLTFTGGFDMTNVSGIEQGFDERVSAERLAHLLQTEHYDVVLHAGDMPAAMEKLSWHLDDPRCGMCHQNWYTTKLASRFVKVCLSGAGGDELFGGYPWRYGAILDAEDESAFAERAYRHWHRLLPPDRLGALLATDLRPLVPVGRERFRALLAGAPSWDEPLGREGNLLQRAFHIDYTMFLQGLLVVEDRISAAHSMETRVPFLDNDLAAFALAIPPALKVDVGGILARRNGGHMESADGKLVLRRAMERFLPVEYTRTRKQGFSPPDANWYRGPSLDYIKEILLDPRTLARPWFDQEMARRLLDEHFTGRSNHRLLIWSLLSLEWLQRHFVDGKAAA